MTKRTPNLDEPRPEVSAAAPGELDSRERIERLFREYNDGLLGFIAARLHSWSEARDIAQEAYTKLLGLEDGRVVSFQRSYLYRIAENLVRDRLRQREVRFRHEHLVFFDENDRERDIPSAEAESISHEERERLERAVAELPGRCRLVFTMVELEGKPLELVAAQLRIKPESARRLVHRAYEYLAEELVRHMTPAKEAK